MTEDTKKLENLSYRSKECPANPSTAPMGFNSVVIKPETRVNNSKVAGQHPEQSIKAECKTCGDAKEVICDECGGTCDFRAIGGNYSTMCNKCNLHGNIPCPDCQLTEQPKICNCVRSRHLEGAIACPDCAEIEQPNQNLMIIEEIEGLMSQVNEKLYKLPTDLECFKANICTNTQRGKALEEIDLFQKTTLFELRKAFE